MSEPAGITDSTHTRRWKAALIVFLFLFATIPVFVFTNFDKFVKDKMPREWLAEKGWWSMAGVKLALFWLLTSTIAALLAYCIATFVENIFRRRAAKAAEAPTPQIGADVDRLRVAIRGLQVQWETKYYEREQGYPFDAELTGGFPLRVYLRDQKIKVDAHVYSGSEYLEVKQNQMINKPPLWDENFNDRSVEIVNEKQLPVFQMIFDPPNRVTIDGVFSPKDVQRPMRAIFKYPTSEYGLGHHDLRPPLLQ